MLAPFAAHNEVMIQPDRPRAHHWALLAIAFALNIVQVPQIRLGQGVRHRNHRAPSQASGSPGPSLHRVGTCTEPTLCLDGPGGPDKYGSVPNAVYIPCSKASQSLHAAGSRSTIDSGYPDAQPSQFPHGFYKFTRETRLYVPT